MFSLFRTLGYLNVLALSKTSQKNKVKPNWGNCEVALKG
ncbi:hypothetical protein SLEP1_g25392 [Rubroshorea leprosula]|uniref:Uncharacterized protein n=1 Tax=Rubroshorea leprosula TaxID=152421 RepID=A0AAV5JIK7_9ROSI|nr:hypothetical protein SLEP1_g25392 [Rubroshorea leprosula]